MSPYLAPNNYRPLLALYLNMVEELAPSPLAILDNFRSNANARTILRTIKNGIFASS
ncbi:hypothetical protein [Cellvibrio sp. KY-GH-1]|uniref:hypothetical protein n=1 Tax=Cellvibrio sp. KY-GH-1 TaxID=2303332 RepID=UPI00177FFD79|nr:hypothetical protein [Cellvibrio sp. KY-GH-1]